LESISVSYLAAYAVNLYVKENLLLKVEKKEYDAIKWSFDQGNEWLIHKPEEGENPDEDDKETEKK
jgi:hypothetical protein